MKKLYLILVSLLLVLAVSLSVEARKPQSGNSGVTPTKPKQETKAQPKTQPKKSEPAAPKKKSGGSSSSSKKSSGRSSSRETAPKAETPRQQAIRTDSSFTTSTDYDGNITFTSNTGVTFKMIKVEHGSFRMGSDKYDNEKPIHSVTLTNDYWIGETEVTQALWKAVMGDNPSYYKGDNLPVERVSWDECKTFITKLNQLTGKTFRLPTEAEWEFAARGGNSSKGYTYSGSNTIGDVAWYLDNSDSKTHTVKTKRPNELGIYDMTGNVWEWCQDWYDSGYYSKSPSTNPCNNTSTSYRVIRGGSRRPVDCRVAYRACDSPDSPNYRNYILGFRLVLPKAETPRQQAIRTDSSFTTSTDYDGNITFTSNTGVTFKMIKVEHGSFRMGSDKYDDEKPIHSVTLTNDYWIGETEVTQALWKAVMGDNPSYYKGDNLPVERVSWDECKTFITKLNQLTGKTFRLPTEAEWEFAARGGNSSKGYTYSGSNTIGDVAWYLDNSDSKTHTVKTKRPNELGIYDMSGNVWEWCQDWYDSGYYSKSPSTNPCNNTSTSYRVRRGGGRRPVDCRVAYRACDSPDYRSRDLGFRLVL